MRPPDDDAIVLAFALGTAFGILVAIIVAMFAVDAARRSRR